MDRERLAEIGQSLPVFPLPRVVLMPGALLPLHVFEPRYRALVTHCRAGHGLLGVATLRPGFEADYHHEPPIFPEVGVGEIVACQPFPDGRFNIVLQYVGFVRAVEELRSSRPFRLVRADVPELDQQGLEPALGRLRLLVLQLGAVSSEAADEARRLVHLDGTEMVDSLARKLIDDPTDQRAYLAAVRVADRIEAVEQRLARFVTALAPVADA